jgi:transcriptional regulator with XRE-family HTH domain
MLEAVAELPLVAQFLRARREALSPEDVGLRSSGRRRTPGLRREEVATLAGVSIDYLVRLEQGRDTNPSTAVVSALSEALRLTSTERHHLAALVAQSNNSDFCPGGSIAVPSVPATVVALVEQLDPTPAVIVGPYGDLLAWNPAFGALAEPMGMLVGDTPSLPWFTFLHPAAADVFVDWEAQADEQTSLLRSAALRWRDDERFISLLAELQQVPAFEARWSSHQVTHKRRGTKSLRHPDLGLLHIDYEAMALNDEAGQQIYAWLPADPATAAAFERVAGATPVSPAQLRVVGEA